MLTASTQHQLTDFFMTIANGELDIEGRRQKLAANSEFEPYSSFVRIDRNGDGHVDAVDLRAFLCDNSRSNYDIPECEFLIRYFDVDGDRALNYTEFLQMILPCDNLTLRSVASQRPAGANIANVQDNGSHVPVERVFMSYTVERQLTDFFAAEIDLHLRLDAMKRQLHSKADWNLH